MHKLIELIEKGKPFFEKISRNIYLRAIRDGFIAGMPVILFSSIFILIAYVPNAWGFHWSKDIETFLMTPYSYSMGILAFFVGGTTAKALTDSDFLELRDGGVFHDGEKVVEELFRIVFGTKY